ncbi:MAG: SbcC/MukB-like Walker B domain-containing protein [Bacteroidota bacterium]
MEVYNWGTFHEKIFKINPQGNNSLLTGANASGKSTFIDALLTLLVSVKKDRFYNQSSGVDKKGDRTEETYVCGHYGNIQREGELSTTIQALRDKKTYSVILASFSNTDQKNITLFQVRWFLNGELKRVFGAAHVPLEIEKDFNQFDSKGNWKKRLDKIYNSNSNKRKVEFLDGPTSYAERIAQLFGMRSVKALSLFNQVVGVKVLEDLDEFIKTNMLEEQDAETEFIQLKESFLTLMDAKINIEKAKEQISQLTAINEIAIKLNNIQTALNQLNNYKEIAVFWFAKRSFELSAKELVRCEEHLKELNNELMELRSKEDSLKQEERTLSISIEREEVWNKIKDLEKEIKQLEKNRDFRKQSLDKYNKIAQSVELNINPSEITFKLNREIASSKKTEIEKGRNTIDETLRQAKNKKDELKIQISTGIETIKALQKNKSNIAGREAEIRDDILEHIGATKEELPFIGELIKVSADEIEWELAVEKILHNFALRLIVPEKYYSKINEYVNSTNLKGRIIYQRYRGFTSLASMIHKGISQNSLINKLEFKPQSIYADWLEDVITNQHNYACVNTLKEFNNYDEKAITKEGLIKFARGKHEKDDRWHISRKENYVLGWDNKDKIKLLQNDIRQLQAKEILIIQDIRSIEQNIKTIEAQKEAYSDLFKLYTKYDDIDWQTYAKEILGKEEQKSTLEKTNNRVQVLQNQLKEVQNNLRSISDIDIKNKDREIFHLEANSKSIAEDVKINKGIIEPQGKVDVSDFEKSNPEIVFAEFLNIKAMQAAFQKENFRKISEIDKEKRTSEDDVKLKINAFKQPLEEITYKFKDWRSDVSRLPDSSHLEFISEYQTLLKQLVDDNLPKYEKKFNEYLQETITNKVGDFRMFFENWSESIKENIRLLNDSLKEIDFRDKDFKTYIQIVIPNRVSDEVKEFRALLNSAIPNIREIDSTIDGRKNHFYNNIEPLITRLAKEDWRKKVMEVRSWFGYKAEEFYKENNQKFKTYENMGQLSGGEKAQLTYTILGSAIAYQFGLTKEGLQSNSFRFIAIDEAFKAQDEDKARYLITLCKQLHLQLLVVTPSDNIHIVENDISFVHFVERKEEKYSWLYDMPIEQFKQERTNFVNQ